MTTADGWILFFVVVTFGLACWNSNRITNISERPPDQGEQGVRGERGLPGVRGPEGVQGEKGEPGSSSKVKHK